MLSPQFVNGNVLRKQIGGLNSSGAIPKKLKAVGIKKDELVKNFLAAVEGIAEGSEEEKKLPDDVVTFYNTIVQGEDPSKEELDKIEADKKKKTTRPAGPSNEKITYDMVKAGKTDDEIATFYNKRYAERGQTDAAFIKKRIAIYINIAKKRIAKETGAPAAAPEAAEAAEAPEAASEATSEDTAEEAK